MTERKLNFAEQAVQVLTLEELERSYHENLPTGDPVGGIYHLEWIFLRCCHRVWHSSRQCMN